MVTSPDGKETFIVYHAHRYKARADPRDIFIDRLVFTPAPQWVWRIKVQGPTRTPQPLPSGTRVAQPSLSR